MYWIVIHHVNHAEEHAMSKTNAERQADFRTKQQSRINAYVSDEVKNALDEIVKATDLTQKKALETCIMSMHHVLRMRGKIR